MAVFSWDPRTWISHLGVLERAWAAVEDGVGFSLCRIGDGEIFVLGRHLQIMPPANAWMTEMPNTLAIYDQHAVWPTGLSPDLAEEHAAGLIRCLREASMVGLWWHEELPGIPYQRGLLDLVIKEVSPELFDSPDSVTHCAAPYLFPYSPRFVELLKVKPVCVVGGFAHQLQVLLRDQVDARVIPVVVSSARDLEAAWEQMVATKDQWSVCLLSCATSAKILALRADQELERVALDIGWLGNALVLGIMAANDPRGFWQPNLPR